MALIEILIGVFAGNFLGIRTTPWIDFLATVNSFGDLLSSVVVGFLWTRVSIAAGFGYAAVLTFAGAVALPSAPTDRTPDTPTADAQTISGSSKPVVSH